MNNCIKNSIKKKVKKYFYQKQDKYRTALIFNV